jgi:hypothetical protein
LKQIGLVLLFLLLSGAACSPASTPVPAPTSAPLVKTPAAAWSDDVLVIFHKTSSAGISEILVVHQGGLLELTPRGGATKSRQVDEAMIQPLRRLLEQKDFGELPESLSYVPEGPVMFSHVITARDTNGNVKTVRAMHSETYAGYLGRLIAMLNQLRAQVK